MIAKRTAKMVYLLAGLMTLFMACKKDDEDVAEAIVRGIFKYGGRAPSAPIKTADIRVVKRVEDADGVQLFCSGDRTLQIKSLISSLYAAEPKLLKTNKQHEVYFSYAGDQLGVALQCGLDSEKGTPSTQIVIVNPKRL